MSALWGLAQWGMGAARSCLRAGLSTWGADLNPQACANLLAEGACEGCRQRQGVRRSRGCVSYSGRQCRPGQTGFIR